MRGNSENRGYKSQFGREILQQGESKFEFPRTGHIQESKCSKSNSWKSNTLFFQWSKSLYSWFRQHKLVGVPKHSKFDFDIVVLLMSVVLKSTPSPIVILNPKLRLLPDRIATYNLDFRSFHTRKGETTIFQKNRKFIF